jgi:hypothetical protein
LIQILSNSSWSISSFSSHTRCHHSACASEYVLFVLVKQVTPGRFRRSRRTRAASTALLRQNMYFCTSKASTFVLVKPGKSHRSRRPRADSTALLRQNVYFCTSKARKLRTSRKSGPVITMASLSPSSRHVRYQHLHFSTSKASKLSTNTRLVRIALFENATLEVSVLVLSY